MSNNMSLEESKKIIRSVLISSPVSINVSQLENDTYNLIGGNIPFMEYGFNTFYEFILHINDVCLVTGKGKMGIVLPVITDNLSAMNRLVSHNKENSKNRGMIRYGGCFNLKTRDAEGKAVLQMDCEEENPTEFSCTSIPQSVKQNIHKLLQDNPKGIWFTYFMDKYRARFGHALNIHQYGYALLLQFLADMPDVVNLLRPGGCRGDYMLFSTEVDLPDPDTLPFWPQYYPIKELTLYRKKKDKGFTFPSCAVPAGYQLQPQLIMPSLKQGDCFDVVLSVAFNPNNFYVHLLRQETHINSLHKHMLKFYSVEGNHYKLPAKEVCVDLLCAAPYLGETDFKRAKVLKLHPDGYLEIFFVDIGSTKLVKVDTIRMLHKDFANLNEQAIALSLYDILPTQLVWKNIELEFFWNHIKNGPLRACFQTHLQLDNIYQVQLYKTFKPFTDIGCKMVQHEFATYKKDLSVKQINIRLIFIESGKRKNTNLSTLFH